MRVSKEEIREAKVYDVKSYLERADPYELVKVSGNEYRLRSHDSFRISNGLWHWFSRGRGGRSAVDYLIYVKGYCFPDAVKEVNSVMRGVSPTPHIPKKTDFKLPIANEINDIAISYLLRRGIDETLVRNLVEEGLIYENKEYHSVIFVGRNDEGKPAYAAYRRTDGNHARGDCKGSNKKFSFRLGSENSKVVHVFEGAIDLLSFITICMMEGRHYEDESYLSLGGVSSKVTRIPAALDHYLETHPDTEKIILHLDNDEIGRACSRGLVEILKDKYDVKETFPKHGKDVNDSLLATRRLK